MKKRRLQKGLWTIILTVAMVLAVIPVDVFTMKTQAATQTVTKTVKFDMDGGQSGTTAKLDDYNLYSTSAGTLHWSCDQPIINYILYSYYPENGRPGITRLRGNLLQYEGTAEFCDIVGKVTKVEISNFRIGNSGVEMCVGKDRTDVSTLLHLEGTTNDFDYSSTDGDYGSVVFEGEVDVDKNNPLKIMLYPKEISNDTPAEFVFSGGSITITYEVEEEVTGDPGHTFSFNATGNTLTATCNQNDANHACGLTNCTATLTLTANDMAYDGRLIRRTASLNTQEFSNATGITDIVATYIYEDKNSHETSPTGVIFVGDYTVTATIIINGDTEHPYILTKDFSVVDGHKINNVYSQFSLSKSAALKDEEVTITYSQKMDESFEELKLIGATSGNSIPYTTNTDGTYTFTMPDEDVNLNATITYPLDENDITQDGDTFTIKTADGWDYFCQRMKVDGELNGFSGKTVELGDDITVNTMAGNNDYPFKGTFDGKGHTLTFNTTALMANTAPFHLTDGATIRNLHVTGLIEGGIYSYMGGLVGQANGNLTIENCRVSTQISSTVSGTAFNGGFVGLLSSQYNQCHITGCVFDGLIYNPNYSGTTYGCGGFVGCFSEYGYAILKDCLFIEGQYDNNNGKCELWWGNENDKNSTFLHRNSKQGEGTLTNCFYVGTHGLKQGSPVVESATGPTNFAHFGDPTTDYGFLKVYGHTMVFNNKYYTPTYGDLVETYDFNGVKSYNIEYDDDKPLGIPDIASPLWASCLRYERKFTAGKPVTIMLPFNFTKNDLKRGYEGDVLTGHFYEFKGVVLNPQTNKWEPVMIDAGQEGSNEVTEMKANTPYLFVPTMNTVPHPYMDNLEYVYIENINIYTVGNNGGTKETEYNGSNWNKWRFVGTYEPHYWSRNENLHELGKVYGIAGSTKEVQGVIVEAGDFTRAYSDAKVRSTSGYFVWTGYDPDDPTSGNTSSSGSYSITLPDNFEIVSVTRNGVKYTGENIPDNFLKDDHIVIRPKEGYVATNISATYSKYESGLEGVVPNEIPDYDDWLK